MGKERKVPSWGGNEESAFFGLWRILLFLYLLYVYYRVANARHSRTGLSPQCEGVQNPDLPLLPPSAVLFLF